MTEFATAVYTVLEKVRRKKQNAMFVGSSDCGKTSLLNSLVVIYNTFVNPTSDKRRIFWGCVFKWLSVEWKFINLGITFKLIRRGSCAYCGTKNSFFWKISCCQKIYQYFAQRRQKLKNMSVLKLTRLGQEWWIIVTYFYLGIIFYNGLQCKCLRRCYLSTAFFKKNPRFKL